METKYSTRRDAEGAVDSAADRVQRGPTVSQTGNRLSADKIHVRFRTRASFVINSRV